MTKRTRYILAALLALAVVGFAVIAMLPPQPGVSQPLSFGGRNGSN